MKSSETIEAVKEIFLLTKIILVLVFLSHAFLFNQWLFLRCSIRSAKEFISLSFARQRANGGPRCHCFDQRTNPFATFDLMFFRIFSIRIEKNAVFSNGWIQKSFPVDYLFSLLTDESESSGTSFSFSILSFLFSFLFLRILFTLSLFSFDQRVFPFYQLFGAYFKSRRSTEGTVDLQKFHRNELFSSRILSNDWNWNEGCTAELFSACESFLSSALSFFLSLSVSFDIPFHLIESSIADEINQFNSISLVSVLLDLRNLFAHLSKTDLFARWPRRIATSLSLMLYPIMIFSISSRIFTKK